MATDPGRMGPGGGVGRRLSTETRRAPTTTEFFSYVLVAIAVLIAGLVIKGDDDTFRAPTVWLYVVILTVGYMLSRGWAKSGARERYWDDADSKPGAR